LPLQSALSPSALFGFTQLCSRSLPNGRPVLEMETDGWA
jgi:hypothetical protein